MLYNYSELAVDLQNKFREIELWPEISFDDITINLLSQLPNVKSVNKHSIQFEVDSNQVIVPSQYLLYAVCVKELALKLHDHIIIFDNYKRGKSTEELGSAIVNNTFNRDELGLDAYSESIAFSVFSNPELTVSAKSFVNGTEGSFRLRSTSDFFSSVLLKIINVPDASSAILGKLIFELCRNRDVYSHIEKAYISKIPFITRSNRIGHFVKGVIEFLIQYNNFSSSFLEEYTIQNQNQDQSFFSIRDQEIKLTSIFKKSSNVLSEEELSQGGRPRYFSDPIYIDSNNQFVYLSTEWTFDTDSRLDLTNFVFFIQNRFPEFSIQKVESNYMFSHKLVSSINSGSEFRIDGLINDVRESGLSFNNTLLKRLVASLQTKPFLILTGLTGSGKTKLAQSFTYWLSGTEDQYEIVPVGADWTNREPLLGYPDGLNQETYIHPDSKVLELIMRAEESDLPHFIILDEMNLSHVERYFADFLSIMESGETAKLYSGANRKDGYGKDVPQQISWPKNLYIIGTVNIDESTYMFSPKVLDRANVIEFRVTELEMETFLKSDPIIDLSKLKSKGASMGIDFVSLSNGKNTEPLSEANQKELLKFFGELKKLGAEFGYRSASEISSLLNNLNKVDSALSMEDKLDIAIMQKMLPKLHGSRSKLLPVLEKLGKLCLTDNTKWDTYVQNKDGLDIKAESNIVYKLSFEKVIRMYANAMDNGFASYAEA